MKTIQLKRFIETLSNDTVNIQVLDLKYNGFNTHGSKWFVTVKQTLKPLHYFYENGKTCRTIQLEFSSLYSYSLGIPYVEKVFLQAFFRQYILDNFN